MVRPTRRKERIYPSFAAVMTAYWSYLKLPIVRTIRSSPPSYNPHPRPVRGEDVIMVRNMTSETVALLTHGLKDERSNPTFQARLETSPRLNERNQLADLVARLTSKLCCDLSVSLTLYQTMLWVVTRSFIRRPEEMRSRSCRHASTNKIDIVVESREKTVYAKRCLAKIANAGRRMEGFKGSCNCAYEILACL